MATSRRSKDQITQQSMFWSEAHLAKLSPSPASEADWLMSAATWPWSSVVWLTDFAPGGSVGRTSPVSCHREMDGTLVPSSGPWQNSGMGSPTEFLTLNTSEYPNDAVVSSLLDILETGVVPRRFFLSAKACAGILRRAAKRGKELPAVLSAALRQVSTPNTGKDSGHCGPTAETTAEVLKS